MIVRIAASLALALVSGVTASAQTGAAMVMRQLPAESLPAFVRAFESGLAAGTLPDGSTFASFHINGSVATKPLSSLGIANGDVLRSIDEYSVRSAEMALKLIREVRPGSDCKLAVARGGKECAFVIEIVPSASPQPAVPAEAAPAQPVPAAAPVPKAAADGVMILNEKELEQALADVDPLQMLADAEVQFVQDDDGNVLGLMSPHFSDIPLSANLGLRSGDIVRAVNGLPVDSELAVFDIIDKLTGHKQFAAQILRNGKPIVLKYRVQ